MKQPKITHLVGLDLGQLSDYTALCHVEKTDHGTDEHDFWCGHIDRFALGTSYTRIVESVVALTGRPELGPNPTLIIDATGVGRAVLDMFRRTIIGRSVEAVTITGGKTTGHAGWQAWNVCKRDLVGAAQAALSSGRLKIVKTLPHADTLRKELLDYRVKVTAAAHEVFEARSGQHDDLVLALSCAVWFGTRSYWSAGAI